MLDYNHYAADPMGMELRNRATSVPNLSNIPRHLDELPSHVVDNAGVTYEVGKFLGKGGFAKCYLASSDGQEFALKVIAKESIKRPSHLNKIKKKFLRTTVFVIPI